MAYKGFVFLVISFIYVHANREAPVVLWYPFPISLRQRSQALGINAAECRTRVLNHHLPPAPPLDSSDNHIAPTIPLTQLKSNELEWLIPAPSGSEKSSHTRVLNHHLPPAPPLYSSDNHIAPMTPLTQPKSNELEWLIPAPSGSEKSSHVNGSDNAPPGNDIRLADEHGAIPDPAIVIPSITESYKPDTIKEIQSRIQPNPITISNRLDVNKVMENYLSDPKHNSNCANILREVLTQLRDMQDKTYLSTDSSKSSQLQQHAKI